MNFSIFVRPCFLVLFGANGLVTRRASGL